MKTPYLKGSDLKPEWLVIDASGIILGELATAIAVALRGKNKATFTPHLECGDYVVVINAEKIVVTGNKMADKMYYTHSGKRGKLKTISLQDHLAKDAPGVIKKAVQGMLPQNKLRKSLLNKLKVYSGADHKHQAQQLKELKVS